MPGGGPQLVASAISRLGPVVLQVPGQQEIAVARSGRAEVTEAFPMSGPDDPLVAARSGADLVLLDGPRPGSEEPCDWSLADAHRLRRPFGIAGDVGLGDIGAVRSLGADSIDVSSGAESAPGIEDPSAVRALAALL